MHQLLKYRFYNTFCSFREAEQRKRFLTPFSGAVDEGLPAICLNPSHGKWKDGYNYDNIVLRDLEFIRANVRGVD